MVNPFATADKVLNVLATDLDAATAAAKAYLVANADKQIVSEAAVRATHALLADPRCWNEVRGRLGV